MKAIGMRAAAVGLGFALVVASCSGGGSGGSGSGNGSGAAMFIETCSLGCSGGQTGNEVTCSIVNVPINADVYAVFSQPVDSNSVSDETFNVKDVLSAAQPPGNLFVDPNDPRRVVFRPTIVFVNGSPEFGFNATATYKVTIPGEGGSEPGPFIQSLGGRKNKSRMRCSIKPILGVTDVVSGPPTVDVLVSVALVSPPVTPADVIHNQPANGAIDVWSGSTIKFIFRDIMNPSTVLDESSGQPPAGGLTIKFDIDGDLATLADQVTLPGTYTLEPPDQTTLQTILTFTPSNGLPSAGDPLFTIDPRKVVIDLPPTIQDLVGNSIAGSGTLAFTPESVLFAPLTLPDADGENFNDTTILDAFRSGAVWGNGRLQRGQGGGSGRLGSLRIGTSQTVTLNTDSQVFPLPNTANELLLDVAPGVDPAITVTNGIFEFSSVLIEPGGTLVLEGQNAARVFARGSANIQAFGEIDIAGGTPAVQFSDAPLSNPVGDAGPGGGDGGRGADRPDNTGHTDILQLLAPNHGISNPGAIANGQRGEPVGRDSALDLSGGSGGNRFPLVFPVSVNTVPPDVGGLKFSFDAPSNRCACFQVASGGAGGAYAADGRPAFPRTPVTLNTEGFVNLPLHPAPGGLASAVGIEAPDPESSHNVRRLRFEAGHLRGGAGGGGGGAHLLGTQSSSPQLPCAGTGIHTNVYIDHSGASGGGGGGALQLVAGDTLTLSGKILALGGNGGNAFVTDNLDPEVIRTTRSSPGGGGSGGALRLQSESVLIDTNTSDPVRIDVNGGLGGTNAQLGLGGRGGHGLVRIEDLSGVLTRVTESPKISPFVPAHINPTTGLQESENVVSVGDWIASRIRPESFSGSMSCWLRPPGNYFRLIFTEDDEPNGIFGWSMDVVYDAGAGEVLLKYREADVNSPFPTPLEDVPGLQNGLNAQATQNCVGDYFAVRFQGARADTDISADPCNVVLSGTSSQIEEGSLTPWVKHPAELNDFEIKPNMIRFAVVFDGRMIMCGAPATSIKGITNLKIEVRPD